MMEPSLAQHKDDIISDVLVWDAHAEVLPNAKTDLNVLHDWHDNNADHLSINVQRYLMFRNTLRQFRSEAMHVWQTSTVAA